MRFLQKLTSRKFILALSVAVAGIASCFGGEELVSQIAGSLTAFGSAVVYIISEGMIDCASIPREKEESGHDDGVQ